MEFWKEILAIWGIGTGGLAIVGWLAKSLIKALLTKDVEAYKQRLKLESDKEIEVLKKSLERTAFEHEVRFGRLHEERAHIIKALHQKALVVETGLFKMYDKYYPTLGSSLDVDDNEVMTKVGEFRDLYEKNRIYFSTKLCSLIESFSRQFEEGLEGLLSQALRMNPDNRLDDSTANDIYSGEEKFNIPPQQQESDRKPFLQVRDESRAVREKIEDEFRRLLGVK